MHATILLETTSGEFWLLLLHSVPIYDMTQNCFFECLRICVFVLVRSKNKRNISAGKAIELREFYVVHCTCKKGHQHIPAYIWVAVQFHIRKEYTGQRSPDSHSLWAMYIEM